MPMHILLVKLVIFRTCIFILIIVAIDYTLRISLQQFYALLNHRQCLTISRVALVKTCKPFAIGVFKVAFEDGRKCKPIGHNYQLGLNKLLEQLNKRALAILSQPHQFAVLVATA